MSPDGLEGRLVAIAGGGPPDRALGAGRDAGTSGGAGRGAGAASGAGAAEAVGWALRERLIAAGAEVAWLPAAASAEQAARALADAVGEGRRVDALVICPAEPPPAPLAELDPAAFARALDAALRTPFAYARALLPGMVAAGWGRVVAVTSTAAITGEPGVAHLAAGERGAVSLMRSIALEAAPAVTANVVAAGPMAGSTLLAARVLGAPGAADAAAEHEAAADGVAADVARSVPSGRLTEPSDVADAVLWLLDERRGQVSGQVTVVAGGGELHGS